MATIDELVGCLGTAGEADTDVVLAGIELVKKYLFRNNYVDPPQPPRLLQLPIPLPNREQAHLLLEGMWRWVLHFEPDVGPQTLQEFRWADARIAPPTSGVWSGTVQGLEALENDWYRAGWMADG